MKMLRTIVLLFGFYGVTLTANALEPIDIGGISAAMGDDQAELLAKVREKYDVNELRGNTYVVYDGDPSENTIGVVQFRDEQLVWASRDVGSFEGEAVRNFARTLFQTLAELNPNDREEVRLTTVVSTMQPIAFGSITLEFSGRKVVIDIGYDGKLADASIEEILYVDDTPH